MYFASRLQAGRMLASRLVDKYRYEDCVVIALNDGGVIVGMEVAKELHCALNMLMTDEIKLPREPVAVGGITADGNFIYNPEYSESEIEEIASESRGTIEEQKLVKLHEMNRLLGSGGLINHELLADHNIILVSDGLRDNFSLELAAQFLKTTKIERLIVATPLASINAVDWMHVHADEICCLSVVEEFMETDHYYDKQDVPDRETIVKTLERMVLNWR